MRRSSYRLCDHSMRLFRPSWVPDTSWAASFRAFGTSSRRFKDVVCNGAVERYNAIGLTHTDPYPRIVADKNKTTCAEFVQQYWKWASETPEEPLQRTVHGRISRIRFAGSKLIFVNIVANSVEVQGVCNLGKLQDVTGQQLKACFRQLQRGDIVELEGTLLKTSSTKPSVQLSRLPRLLSPCLHPLPLDLQDPEMRIAKRHVDFLVNDKAAHVIRTRSQIIQSIRQFLLDENHIEVQTPILAAAAGGAIARPFRTQATEFVGKELALRIAPELWLKRMVVGGFDRVFEIGQSFRNEGIDLSHNPEFTTCEFYRAYTNLNELMNITERLLDKISVKSDDSDRSALSLFDRNLWKPAYNRIDFITGIEKALNIDLPLLSSPTAFEDIKQIVNKLKVPMDTARISSLPQLLDKICGEVLEPLCQRPTFIINHPECMSPLSKSFEHAERPGQRIAARAELFVRGQELANMYEEENSPVEQRRKFEEQLKYKGDHTGIVDEAYLEMLEWGLPPTGGWGCGIERLTMALTSTDRIGDVLSFGTLRNVIGKHQRH